MRLHASAERPLMDRMIAERGDSLFLGVVVGAAIRFTMGVKTQWKWLGMTT
jgi:hypothetical protein